MPNNKNKAQEKTFFVNFVVNKNQQADWDILKKRHIVGGIRKNMKILNLKVEFFL